MSDAPLMIEDNVIVSLDYSLVVDGEVIDSTENAYPLEYIQGHNNLIPGLEQQLEGMKIGDSKEVVVSPRDGYGEYNPDAFADLERSQFPSSFPLEIGRSLRVSTESGQIVTARIAEIGEESVRLDLNHPLAGKELTFQTKIANLRNATEDEINFGRVGGGGCASCSSSSGCSGSCG